MTGALATREGRRNGLGASHGCVCTVAIDEILSSLRMLLHYQAQLKCLSYYLVPFSLSVGIERGIHSVRTKVNKNLDKY